MSQNLGCGIKAEVEALWRRHFVLHEDMLEISGPCLTPHVVLKVSGHADRFCDLLCEDTKTSDMFRADKLLENWIDAKLTAAEDRSEEETQELQLIRRQADGFTAVEMAGLFEKFGITSPAGNGLTAPIPFNLMFKLLVKEGLFLLFCTHNFKSHQHEIKERIKRW